MSFPELGKSPPLEVAHTVNRLGKMIRESMTDIRQILPQF